MDISDLKYMLAIEEYKNISDAAVSCNVSQSVISKHLAKLETEIGDISLCNRSKRPVSLTPAGEEFVQYARRIVDEYEDLVRSMTKYSSRSDNVLRAGSIPVMGRMGIADIIADFRQHYDKDIDISIVDRPTMDLLELLDSGDIDAAVIITSPDMKLDRKYTVYPLARNTLKLAVNRKHRFANRSSVSLHELSNERIALADERTGMFPVTSKALDAANISGSNIKKYRNIETVISEIIAGRAVSFLSETLAASYESAGIRLISVDKKIQSTTALVISNSSHIDRLLKDFIDYILSAEK